MGIKRKSGFGDKPGNGKAQKGGQGQKQSGGNNRGKNNNNNNNNNNKNNKKKPAGMVSDDFVVDEEENDDDDSSSSESEPEGKKKTNSTPSTPSKQATPTAASSSSGSTTPKKTTPTPTKAKTDEDSDDDIFDPALTKFKKGKTGPGSDKSEFLIILDLASLETVKTKKGDFQLLNCDDHIGLIRKFRKDPNEYRPDIIHQELMAVLDSPLNKAGRVKVLVHTEKNVLFEVSSKTRIPRTFKRFSGLMVQLLHRLKIRSSDGGEMLLKVVKNPISRHIPAGARCIGFSDKGKLMSPMTFAKELPKEGPIVLLFGAQATKGILAEQHDYLQELVSISEYPLSGIVAVNRVLGAIEDTLNIA